MPSGGTLRELVEHYTDNKDSIMIGAALIAWAAASMAFFGGYLRTVLRDRGGDSGFLPSMAMAGALAIAIGGSIDATIIFTMAETADDVGPGTILTLSALYENDFFPIALGTFIFLLATGLSVVRGAGALPKWLGWVAILLAVVTLTPIGFVGFMGMGLFTLIVSILLTIRAGSPAAPRGTARTGGAGRVSNNAPGMTERATEEEHHHLGAHRGPDPEDVPDLLRKLQERKKRHESAGILRRIGVVIIGVLLVLLGIVMSGPGVPGPGILVILIGLSFLALEFDRAERILEKAIVWADNAAQRAENATPRQKAITAVIGVLVVGAFVAWALLYDIPLVPMSAARAGSPPYLLLPFGLSQLDPADLARERLRQVVDELDLARVGVARRGGRARTA